jgi:transposase
MDFNDLSISYNEYLRKSGGVVIPSDLRAQIYAAVAEGRVTKIQRGASSLSYGVYDPEKNMVRMPDQQPFMRNDANNKRKALCRQGMVREFAKFINDGVEFEKAVSLMKIARFTANRYVREAKRIGLLPADYVNPAVKKKRDELSELQRKQAQEIAKMWLDGWPMHKICDAMNCSDKVAHKRIGRAKRMGLIPADVRKVPAKDKRAKATTVRFDTAARDRLAAEVRKLWSTGMSVKDLALRLGVTRWQIRKLMERAKEM